VVTDGTGWKVKARASVAGKTTPSLRGRVVHGIHARLVTGVWVDLDRRESLGWHETGSRAAIPIWLSFMTPRSRAAGRGLPRAAGVVFAKIDPGRGCSRPQGRAVVEVFRGG
jgi:penicillin-binding protein 1A